jgi:ribosomal protein S7
MNILQIEFKENSELFDDEEIQEKFINENKKLREVERFINKLVTSAKDSSLFHIFYPKLFKLDKYQKQSDFELLND